MSEENKSQDGASGISAEPVTPTPIASVSGVSGTPAQASTVDPLVVGRSFKKVGDFVVDANFDPTLTPEYKALNNTLVSRAQEAEKKLNDMTASIGDLTTKLSEKEGMLASEKEAITAQLDTMRVAIEVSQKDARASRIDLLKIQTASANGLPYNYVKYVSGDTPESIAKSVKDVLADYSLTSKRFSQEELDAQVKVASEAARTETENALKNRGNPTEHGTPGEKIYTRKEIAAMDLTAYKANRSEIERQQAAGLIK